MHGHHAIWSSALLKKQVVKEKILEEAWDVPASISHETCGESGRGVGDGFTELLVVEQSAPNVWLAMPWEETHRKTDIEI